MKEKIQFKGVVTKNQVAIKDENYYVSFTIQHTEETSTRSLPQQFKNIPLKNVFSAIASNDVFDKVNIPAYDYNLVYEITIGEIQFDARIVNISSKIKIKDGVDQTIYDFVFIKDLDSDMDTKLASMVKYKEYDKESDKKVLKLFDVTMEVVDG